MAAISPTMVCVFAVLHKLLPAEREGLASRRDGPSTQTCDRAFREGPRTHEGGQGTQVIRQCAALRGKTIGDGQVWLVGTVMRAPVRQCG